MIIGWSKDNKKKEYWPTCTISPRRSFESRPIIYKCGMVIHDKS